MSNPDKSRPWHAKRISLVSEQFHYMYIAFNELLLFVRNETYLPFFQMLRRDE